ncbi:hypothetical protein GCM10011575_25690 [Microlunatus endophyticus]|uniref:Uncharacterized protein n=1 Tax=Microlunatus endophyticus TaxID=1716077 RepID=A0A917W5W6_9ACTN|nr:hypothetical protein GCM10011575_25690 [Microlunatus endophyticus]
MQRHAEERLGRDAMAFAERAEGYDDGYLGRMHHQICDRVAELAVELAPNARRIPDFASTL